MVHLLTALADVLLMGKEIRELPCVLAARHQLPLLALLEGSPVVAALCGPAEPDPEEEPGGGVLRLPAAADQGALQAVCGGGGLQAAPGAVGDQATLRAPQARGRRRGVAVVAQHLTVLPVQHAGIRLAV